MIRRLERHALGVLGLFLTSMTLVAALAAPVLAPHDPVKSDFVASLKPPGTPATSSARTSSGATSTRAYSTAPASRSSSASARCC